MTLRSGQSDVALIFISTSAERNLEHTSRCGFASVENPGPDDKETQQLTGMVYLLAKFLRQSVDFSQKDLRSAFLSFVVTDC